MQSGGEASVHHGSRPLAAVLLTLFSGLVLAYLWWGRFEYEDDLFLAITYAGAAVCILGGHWLFADSMRSVGLRLDNSGPAFRQVAIGTVAMAVLVLVAWILLGRPSPSLRDLPQSYLGGAILQQYVLQAFVLQRFLTLCRSPTAAIAASALLFSFLHLPNTPLMAVSLVGALFWCRVFVKTPNLAAVTVSHLVLGLLLSAGFKEEMDYFRVGKGGLAYKSFGDGVLVAGGYDSGGRPFVATLPGQDRDNSSFVGIFRPDGTRLAGWTAFPEYGFSGNLAVGDLGFGPGDEIAVAPGPGVRSPPEIRIFDVSGSEQGRFRLPDDTGYGASVSMASGALLAAGGPAPGAAALCYEMTPAGTVLRRLELRGTGFTNSVRCAGWPADRVLAWSTLVSVNRANLHIFGADGQLQETWTPLQTNYGLNVARLGLESGTGVVVAPGALAGHPSHIQILDSSGNASSSFHLDQSPYSCGANVGAVDVDGDGIDEVLIGEGNCPGRPPRVRVVDIAGTVLYDWLAGEGTG